MFGIVMIKNIELTNEQKKEYIKQLYDSFDNGYQFEEFLKIYFEKLGLDEVSVTKRSRDGGIDLTAIRPGIGNFSDSDIILYIIIFRQKDLTLHLLFQLQV